ncbi:MAG: tRNA adenosine(34) deaminase TadA [Phycisphaerae bacterium]|nr:tRNA adenosine(34) deaminase TadA [Phycisphaerae bacterium]
MTEHERHDDERFMQAALEQAELARRLDDVPIGAVVVCGGAVVAAAHNRRIIDRDPTAHAEMLAIRQAAAAMGDWRLTDCTLYVTLEPCSMCAGAIVLARLARLVYGAADPKAGAVDTLYALCTDDRLNHRVAVTRGVLAEPCGRVLTEFFKAQRAKGKR